MGCEWETLYFAASSKCRQLPDTTRRLSIVMHFTYLQSFPSEGSKTKKKTNVLTTLSTAKIVVSMINHTLLCRPGGMILTEEKTIVRTEACPSVTLSTKFPRGLAWDGNRASAVRGRRTKAWTTRQWLTPVHTHINFGIIEYAESLR